MPMWRCPHCGTPQAETARCWVCRRSSTSCGTCRHYRRSVAGQLGYCGLDRGRQPLTGDEIRGCWESWTVATGTSVPVTAPAVRSADQARPPLEFVEVGAVVVAGSVDGSTGAAPSAPSTQPATDAGWSLWGDLEP